MSDETVTFAGEEFRVAERVGLMPLMRFAHIAKSGADSSEMEGLVAMYDLLEQCISSEQLGRDEDGKPTGPTEWERFMDAATRTSAQGDEFWVVVRRTMAVIAGRPTSRSSDSSDGPTTTEPNSEDDSASVADGAEDYLRVIRRLEAEGRPDKALHVLEAHEAEMTQTSAA